MIFFTVIHVLIALIVAKWIATVITTAVHTTRMQKGHGFEAWSELEAFKPDRHLFHSPDLMAVLYRLLGTW